MAIGAHAPSGECECSAAESFSQTSVRRRCLRRLREIISKRREGRGRGGPPNMTLTRRCMKSGRFIFLRSTRGKAHEVGGYLLGSSDLLRRFQIHHRHYRRFLFRCRSLRTSKAAVSAGRRNRERRDSATSTRRDVQDRIPEGDWHQLPTW